MIARLSNRHHAFADRWINNGELATTHFGEHHKVIQVPMQHAGQLQLVHLVELKPQRAASKAQRLRVAHQLPEVSAFE